MTTQLHATEFFAFMIEREHIRLKHEAHFHAGHIFAHTGQLCRGAAAGAGRAPSQMVGALW